MTPMVRKTVTALMVAEDMGVWNRLARLRGSAAICRQRYARLHRGGNSTVPQAVWFRSATEPMGFSPRIMRRMMLMLSEVDDWARAGGADEAQRGDGQTPSRQF